MKSHPKKNTLALALAALLSSAPASHAAQRHWSFIGGCGSADWISTTTGLNAQGKLSCWAPNFGGQSGQPVPTADDDVFILAPGAASTLLVNLAVPARAAFTAQAHDITLYGNGSFAAGLNIDRHALAARVLLLGAAGLNFLGRVEHSAGSVSISNIATIYAGDYVLSGGVLTAAQLNLRSQQAAARFVQTGGNLLAGSVDIGGDFAHAASFEQLAGQANSAVLTIGTLVASAPASARLSGAGTRWDNTGSSRIGHVGQGVLEIGGGARASSGSAVIGATPGGAGRVSVSGAGSAWTVHNLLDVGPAGSGRLEVTGGGGVSAGGAVFSGGSAARIAGAGSQLQVQQTMSVGRYRATQIEIVDGAGVSDALGIVGEAANVAASVLLAGGASWSHATSLVVGDAGNGRIDIQSGGLLSSPVAAVGGQPGASGHVAMTGVTTRWHNAGLLAVGQGGTGRVTVGGRSQLQTGGAVIASLPLSAGTIEVNGNDSLWSNGGSAVIGGMGHGRLYVNSGGQASSRTALLGETTGAQGRIDMAQSDSRVEIGGRLTLGRAGRGDLHIDTGATLLSQGAVLAETFTGVGVAMLDNGGRWTNTGALVVGQGGQGLLVVGGGATAQTTSAVLGQVEGARGDGDISSGGSWRVGSSLEIGRAGHGRLVIGNGGLVDVGGLTSVAGPGSELVLNGGILRSDQVKLGNPARLDWQAGTLQVTGSAGAGLDGAVLPTLLDVTAGRRLVVDHTLALNASSVLLLSGGSVTAGTLTLDNAVLVSTGGGQHALKMDTIGRLRGAGQVAAAVNGGAAATRIEATGALTLGLLGRSDGFDFNGQLDAGSQQVLLLASGEAGLGSRTLLGDGGQLVSVNGARLAAGERLESSGAATVGGRFVNDGSVIAGSGTLTFEAAVSGGGDFEGDVRFLAGFDPGAAPGAAAAVRFGDGGVAFGEHALLSLQIDGADGSEHDRLLDIGTLNFDGRLALDFGSGFSAAAGARLQLFDFDGFAGQLNESTITISGFDKARLDLSMLEVDGSLLITAVPEPSSWALMLAGACGLAGVRRLKSRSQA